MINGFANPCRYLSKKRVCVCFFATYYLQLAMIGDIEETQEVRDEYGFKVMRYFWKQSSFS